MRPLPDISARVTADQPLEFVWPSDMPSPEVAARINPSTGPLRIVPDQPAQTRLVEFAVAKRRDQRQPQALQLVLQIGCWSVGHRSISLG